MTISELGESYRDHSRQIMVRADHALAGGGYDGLIVGSGSQRYYYLDDSTYPFRPNPRYRAWLPDASPDTFVVYRPGNRPKLVFHQPDDYWYLPPALPDGYWVDSFDLQVVRSPNELKNHLGGKARWAVLAEPAPATDGLGDYDPPAVIARLDYARAVKTPYEIACMALSDGRGRARPPRGRSRLPGRRLGIRDPPCLLPRGRGARGRTALQQHHRIRYPCRRAALPGAGPQPAGGSEIVPDRRRCAARGLCLRHHAHVCLGAWRVSRPDRGARCGAVKARRSRAARRRLSRHPSRGASRDRAPFWSTKIS